MIRDLSLSLALLLLFATKANAQSPKQFSENPALNGGHKGGGSVPNAILERFFTGAAAGDVFGFSVASAGDVNGDGYSDIIIGAYLNDAGGADAGRAYIYFGGAIINNVADVILTGHAATDLFGYSVAGAGDVNGDGYSDVIVGAYGSDSGATNAGRAYLFLGGSSMNNVADVTFTGVGANDNFGFSVAGAGDVNGDGYADVIVAAHRNDAGGVDAGRAYVYFGGSSMDNTVDVTLTGAAAGDQFGVSVASAGDVNGDGFADVIVGGFLNDTGGTDAGRAYIFHGGGSMDNIADVTLTGAAAGDFFGFSVASARDVNGDGYSDVIVGAYLNDAGGADAGQAYLYLGGPSMDNTADATFTGAAAGDFFGVSVASAGDVNGDGYPDIIIGAQWNDAGGADAGRAYVYLGGNSVDNIADAIFTGTAAINRFGRSVASAGDVNNDGYGDIIVGAYLNDDGGADAGKAYLYLNSLNGTDIPDEFFTGAASGDNFGTVSGAGDVNGDGYGDIIVGARSNDAGGNNAGRAYIYFGGPSIDNTADVVLTGAAPDDFFGSSVASAGDVNGDGYDDVIVGASGNDAGGVDAGRAYIYFGGSSMDGTVDVTLTGLSAGDGFWVVAGAGDVNGDGYSDVIVGASGNDAVGSNAGRAYIFLGGSNMNNVADVIFDGEVANDAFGITVSGAGDVNGDGYSDVMVGALFNDAGGVDAGRAYLYFGGAIMDNTADVTLTGAAAEDGFGNSIANAGDVNGDGYSDVIVGARYSDVGGTDAGRAYVYFGGISMDNNVDIYFSSVQDVNFAASVSGSGDVNMDGYEDVIIGSPFQSLQGTNPGRAYIYFGGAAMNNTADVILTGAAAGDLFGASVASAGDVNGDGYGDVIVGALFNNAGGSNAGRSYLYLSSSPPIVPRISAIRDVPNDQGGRVNVGWIRSGYDVRNVARVTSYVVMRSAPPGGSGYQWEQIADVPAQQVAQYSYTAETQYDSTSNASGTFFFRIKAKTSNVNEYWWSNIMSGHSVDNLSPLAPMNAAATPLGNSITRLRWDINTSDPDVGHYRVYRSSVSGFPLADSTRVLATPDTAVVDTPGISGITYYYRITTVDIHGNESAPSPQLTSVAMSTASLSMLGGWNMVSVPLTVLDFAKTTLFPTAVSDAFGYQGSYVVYNALENGDGYWLRFTGAENVEISGVLRDVDTIAVQSGWNMIGSISSPVNVTDIASIPGGIITSQFFGYNGAYFSSSIIDPGQGYWVRTTQSGQLVLSTGPLSGIIQIVPTGDMPPAPPIQTTIGETDLPKEFALEQNYPNPFNPSTSIEFSLPNDVHVSLKVYDLLGQEVATLVNGLQTAGAHSVQWNASALPTGFYFYKIEAGKFTQTRKLMLMK